MSALPDPQFRSEFYADTAAKRLFAWGIDTVVVGLLTALVVPFTGFVALLFLPGLFLVLNCAYRTIGLARHSATLGMRIMAVEIRAGDGGRLDGLTALLHTLGYLVCSAMVLPQLASMLLMATTPRGQGLGDLVLGTAAVNRSARR